MNPLPATRKSKPSLSISATCGRASARRRTSSASAIEVPPGSRQPHTHRLDAGTDSRNWMAHASRGHQRQAPAAGRGGTEGGATAQHLLERDRTVRALVRDPDSAAAIALRRAGANLVVGDLDDPTSLRTAMEGVYGVFLVLTMMVGPKISPEGVVAEDPRLRRAAGPDVHVLQRPGLPGRTGKFRPVCAGHGPENEVRRSDQRVAPAQAGKRAKSVSFEYMSASYSNANAAS